MKLKSISSLTATGFALMLASSAQGAITLTGAEPTTDVLLDAILAGARVNTIINSTAAQGSRGSGFSLSSSLGGPAFDISSVTLDARGGLTYAAGFTFTISIIESDGDADGVYNETFTAVGATNVNGAGFAAAVGGTLVGEETLTVEAGGLAPVNADFINFGLPSPIRVNADTNYALLVSTSGQFNHFEGNNNANATPPTALNRILFNNTITSTPDTTGGSRDLRFSLVGTAVPEPSALALLAIGGLGFLRRRR